MLEGGPPLSQGLVSAELESSKFTDVVDLDCEVGSFLKSTHIVHFSC